MELSQEAIKLSKEGKVRITGSGRDKIYMEGPGEIQMTFPSHLLKDFKLILKQVTCTCKDSSVNGTKYLCQYKLSAIKELFEK